MHLITVLIVTRLGGKISVVSLLHSMPNYMYKNTQSCYDTL